MTDDDRGDIADPEPETDDGDLPTDVRDGNIDEAPE